MVVGLTSRMLSASPLNCCILVSAAPKESALKASANTLDWLPFPSLLGWSVAKSFFPSAPVTS